MTNLSPLVIANKNHTSFHACRHYVSSAFQHAAYKRPRPFINPVHSRYVAFAPASNISSIILQTTLLRTALLDEQMIIWRNGPCRHLCSKPQFLEPRLQRPCALTPDAYPIRKSNLNQIIARSLIHLNNSKTFGSHQFFSTGFQEYVTNNNDSHPSNAKTKNINLPRQQQKIQSKSTNKHKKRKSLTQEEQKRRTLQAISQRLSFFFSDVNLRHDNYARPILEQYNNQYLPLDVIMKFKTIKQLSHDHNEVLQAVNSFSTKAPIKLQIKHESSGEVLIGRSPPFDYEQSLKKSYKKIILAEGWPVDQNTRLVESHFRSMLCVQTDIGVNNSMRSSDYNGAQIPVAFWGKNVAEGVITIEFETEEGAEQAWANLHRAMRSPCVNSAESSHNSDYLAVQSLHLDRNSDGANTTTAGIAKTEHRVHRMKIGDLSLIVRPISVPEANDDLTTNNESMTRVDRCDVETEKATPDINAAMNNDVDISSLFQQNLSSSIPAQSTDTTPTKILDASAPSQSPSLHEGCNSNSWWAGGTATPALGDCINAMNELFEVRNTLPPPPREWLHEYTRRTKKGSLQKNKLTQQQHLQRQQRHAICRNVVNLVTCAKNSILEGTIHALGGKEGYLLSDFLGRAMLVYSESPPPPSSSRSKSNGQISHAEEYIDSYNDRFNVGVGDDISPYEACIDIFHILKKLNLDINPSHYSYAIRAACHESRWEEASNIFLIQIGGGSNDENNSNRNIFNKCNDDGGFVPINPTLGWDQPLQIGLYAVARDAWYKERASEATENAAISPSKQVFDAAMRMCLVSPSGQENYVLAAGAALGRAGLWSDCLDFATDPTSVSYGPSIAAAAMLACIESSRSTEALDAYNFFTSGNQQTASEWQWAGGSITAAKSLCRDLALRAMGGVSSGGCSRDAMLLFCEIVDEDSPLSRNALLGVMHSFEYDGDWQSSIQLLNALVDSISHKSESKWRLVRDTLELSNDYNDSNESLTKSEGKELLVEVLASSMRVCNQEGHFGLAIVLCSILNSFHTNEYGVLQNNEMAASGDATVDLAQSLIVYHDIFEAYAQSLYGLGCDRIVQQLLQDTTKDINDFSFHMLRMRRKGSQVDESWRNAFVAINRVLEAKAAIELEGGLSSRDDSLLFQRGLSRAMEHCLDLNQPAAALYLFRHTSNVLIPAKDTSLADKVRTFLGVERRSGHKPSDEIFETFEKIEMEDMQLSDSILAALIKVYTMMGRPEKARAVFIDSVPHKHDVDEKQIMTQSMNNTLEVFLEINVAECMPFLEKMHVDCLNPFTFLSIARKFSMHGAWPQVGELYNKAHSAGCISEEFGLIAMKAVSESELSHGKIKVLRNIVSDVSNLVGMNKKEWVTSNYWNIKRYAGFHYARLLMQWNDPATSQKEELLFAINEMRECATNGILAKNAPLFCIVKQGELYAIAGESLSEKQRRAAINLILEACVEANKSGLLKKHTFTAEVVRSLRVLRGNEECIRITRALISGGGKCRHRIAMEQGIYAAIEERDDHSLGMIISAFEESGYDSHRLSL